MNTSKITTSGRLTIPKAIRQALKLKAGDSVLFELEGERIILTPLRHMSLMELRGFFAKNEPHVDYETVYNEAGLHRGQMLLEEAAQWSETHLL